MLVLHIREEEPLIEGVELPRDRAVINRRAEDDGVGLISRFTLSPIPHRLRICPVIPAIGTQIGLIACELDDLTPVAGEFARMIREISKNLL